MRPQFSVSLPKHISPERFERTVLTAMNNNPDLLSADRRSLFNACSKSAQDGLLPDGREGALVIFKDRAGKKLVTWMPMIAGIIKKVRQSGEIISLGARIVYQAETVSAGLGPDGKPIPPRFRFLIKDGVETIEHEPMLWGERGPMVLVYAFAKHKGGTVEYEPLTLADVNKIKSVSRAKDKDGKPTGPWRDWYEEMAKKSAIRRLSKRLPVSSEVMATLDRDDEPTEFSRLKHEAQNISDAAAQFSAPAAIEDRTNDVIDAEVEDVTDHDPETGEVTDTVQQTEDTGEGVLAEEVAREAEEDETAFARGKRLLPLCANEKDIADLRASISDELPGEQQEQWAILCDKRKAEIVKPVAVKNWKK